MKRSEMYKKGSDGGFGKKINTLTTDGKIPSGGTRTLIN